MAEIPMTEEEQIFYRRLPKEKRDAIKSGSIGQPLEESGIEESLSLKPALKGFKRDALSSLREKGAPSAVQSVAETVLPEDELDLVSAASPVQFAKGIFKRMVGKAAKEKFGDGRHDADTKVTAPKGDAVAETTIVKGRVQAPSVTKHPEAYADKVAQGRANVEAFKAKQKKTAEDAARRIRGN